MYSLNILRMEAMGKVEDIIKIARQRRMEQRCDHASFFRLRLIYAEYIVCPKSEAGIICYIKTTYLKYHIAKFL